MNTRRRIVELREKIERSGALPEGWAACEGFFLTGGAEPSAEHVSIGPGGGILQADKAELRTHPREERAAIAKQTATRRKAQAEGIAQLLRQRGFCCVRCEHGTVYVSR